MGNKKLKLRESCNVYIDWANVYGWTKSLKKEVDPKKLFKYLKSYKEIKQVNFYFGKDKHEKSREFLKKIKKIGYNLTTKSVKYIRLNLPIKIESIEEFDALSPTKILALTHIRKCDFDMEISVDVYEALNQNIQGFIFFTGDGDFEPLYKLLIKQEKQVIVIYTQGHLGREIWNMKKGIFKIELKNLIDLNK